MDRTSAHSSEPIVDSVIAALRRGFRRTPIRTFGFYPVLVLSYELVRRRGRLHPAWDFIPMMAWGYLQYRLCGNYRLARGGGGPGLEVPPTDLVTSGPYGIVRNPMYLGHIIFLTGLALFARSWLGALVAAGTAWWFDRRVAGDEQRLVERFGAPYVDYLSRVPRWIPGASRLPLRSGPLVSRSVGVEFEQVEDVHGPH
jgi:hypothetical protein